MKLLERQRLRQRQRRLRNLERERERSIEIEIEIELPLTTVVPSASAPSHSPAEPPAPIGDCILQYWNHGAALQPCKCPMCSQKITRLIPEASLDHCQDVEVLESVRKYNRLFVGGTYGLILRMLELPLLIKRIICEMMDPDAANNHLLKARLFAILLGALYTVSPLDFFPAGGLDAIDVFDYFAIALVFILYVVGLYRRQQRLQHVRHLAADHP